MSYAFNDIKNKTKLRREIIPVPTFCLSLYHSVTLFSLLQLSVHLYVAHITHTNVYLAFSANSSIFRVMVVLLVVEVVVVVLVEQEESGREAMPTFPVTAFYYQFLDYRLKEYITS